MPRAEHFQAAALRIEAQRTDTDTGWTFAAWMPHTSQGFTDAASLLRWCRCPATTPTGDALRQWLASLEGAPHPEPAAMRGQTQPTTTTDTP